MKTLQGAIAGLLIYTALGFDYVAPAQVEAQSASASLIQELPPEPQLLDPDSPPVSGTFFMLSDFQKDWAAPPYPCNPFSGAPIYSTVADGIYIVDDSQARPSVFEPVANVDSATLEIWGRVNSLVEKIEEIRTERSLRYSSSLMTASTSSLDPGVPGDWEGGTNEWNPGSGYSAPVYGSNDLYLSIDAVHDGVAELTLHGVQDTNVYMLASSPDLSVGIWQPEDVMRPTSAATQVASVVSLFNRSPLFFRARTWNELTSSGIPEWWWWLHFGTFDWNSSLGYTLQQLQYSFQQGTEPNKVEFSISAQTYYSRSNSAPFQVEISKGVPFKMAILVDQTNLNAAVWVPYSPTISADLGAVEGWHRVDIGLRGRTTNSPVTWRSEFFKFDATPPALVITSPTNRTLTEPLVETAGYSIEDLRGVSFDLSNAAGQLTNQPVYIGSRFVDSVAFETTTNFFAIPGLELTNGVNTVTIKATDRAGNVCTTNIQFTVDYSSKTNPPLVQVLWPHNGDEIGSDSVTINGYVSDLTATVVAQMVNTNGTTNTVEGVVHRNHQFWVPYLPLAGGTNQIMLKIKDVVGNTTVTNLAVQKSSLTITMNPVSDSEIWKPSTDVTGTISDPTYAVWVNGVKGHNNGNGTWSATSVPIPKGGPARFSIVGYSPSEQQPDGSYGN